MRITKQKKARIRAMILEDALARASGRWGE
jgi:hypothetical protein